MNKKQMKHMTDALIFISAIAESMAKQLLTEQELAKMQSVNLACIEVKAKKEALRNADAL
jgi:hypothetical protein